MKFSQLNFDNHFAKLGENFSKPTSPSPLENQRLVAYSLDACELLDLDLSEMQNPEFLNIISGKISHPQFCNLAQVYAGHQFRHFVPTLGDGRAALLTQIRNKKNESWDLVLKGCGLTPFSRPYVQNADGRAVLRSSIREFLISESMFALGIPTARALCLIASDEIIMREMPEKAAQIIRLAPSHLRFGTFEYFFYRQENDKIKTLVDYAIAQYFPQTQNYADFLQNVVESTAKMIAKWQAFGFCHGVLNTDNMSIHGITLDYGPFGFLDEYNPNHICNHSDSQGRYSFKNQPTIGMWNLHAFAITLSSLISMEEQKKILESYEEIFLNEYHKLMAAKLGFEIVDNEVKKVIYDCLHSLEKSRSDYTNFFADLTDKTTDPKKKKLMESVNPRFVLRNHLLQIAIEKAETNDFSEVEKLQRISQKPFTQQDQYQNYYAVPPAWAKEICISCSS